MVVRRLAAALAVAACVGVGATAAQATPGDLDPTFGNGGIARVNLGLREVANGIAIASDGKIVLGGTQINGATATSSLLAARLTATGMLDTSFGQGTGFRTLGTADSGDALVLQPDGAILVAGSRNIGTDYDMLVARFRGSDGLLDPTFASGAGFAVPHVEVDEFAHAIALAPNGKIVLGGAIGSNSGRNQIAMRLNVPDGTQDSTYGSEGMREVTAKAGKTDGAAMTLLPNGDPLIAGSLLDDFGSPQGFELGELLANGSAWQHVPGTDGAAKAIVLLPDGSLLLAGYSVNPYDFVIVHEKPSAGFFQPDPSFGMSGVVRVDLGGTDVANAIAVQPDGKILLAGTTQSGSTTQAAVVRLQPSGILDATFGRNGTAVVPFPGGGKQNISAMALRADGTILLAGNATTGSSSATQDLLVMRLQGDNGPGGSGSVGGGTGDGTGGTRTRVPRCEGRKATIVGTRHADRLKGTRRADVIVALGGNDRVDGKGGNDIICAGDGNDTVIGGAGNDRIDGGNGKDTLKGGPGNDVLSGQGGKDRIDGGAGKDTLKGGPGRDVLLGGSGANKLLQ